jgi:hypothetical protein
MVGLITMNGMKILIATIICALLVTSCSSAFRNTQFIPIEGNGWHIESGMAVYKFQTHVFKVGSISIERFFLVGPVIPFEPYQENYGDTTTCQYKLGRDFVAEQRVSLSFEINENRYRV